MRLSKAIPAAVLFLFGSARGVYGSPPNGPCDLPQSLRHEIADRYRGRKLVGLSDLNGDDRTFFEKDHGNACPGLVKADFYGDGKPTFALVLIAGSDGEMKAELIVAHMVPGSWQTRVLDTADDALVPVVWSQPPGVYRDVYGKKEIRARRPVIVFTRYESWSILYAWTGENVSKIWIAD
jgi:hypothetical protein